MTDQDYVENYREYSPDSSMLLINYSLDLGAFGYGQAGTAILKLSDTTKNLRDFSKKTMKYVGVGLPTHRILQNMYLSH